MLIRHWFSILGIDQNNPLPSRTSIVITPVINHFCAHIKNTIYLVLLAANRHKCSLIKCFWTGDWALHFRHRGSGDNSIIDERCLSECCAGRRRYIRTGTHTASIPMMDVQCGPFGISITLRVLVVVLEL